MRRNHCPDRAPRLTKQRRRDRLFYASEGMLTKLSAALLSMGASVTAWGALPELPRERVDTAMPVQTGSVLRVAGDCGDLQGKIDAARPGDTVEIPHGATCTGNFVLRNKAGSGWVVIRTSGALPEPGHRVTPDKAPQLAKIVTPNSSPAVGTEAGAHHYRLIGLEITAGSVDVYDLVSFGDGTSAQSTPASTPSDLIVDRCYIHGSAHQKIKRGIALNSARTAVIDSYLAEIHAPNQDSQALCGWNGPGPFRIANNFLSASTENVLFGGARGYLPEIVPSDIEIVGNHFYKPLSWKQGDPSFAGETWSIKNILEFKNARRVLIDGNVFDQGLVGFGILFTVRTQGGSMPWAVVEDVTFTRNLMRHVGGGVNISAYDDEGGNKGITQRILFSNNVFEDIDRERWSGSGTSFQILHGPADIKIDHNTLFQSSCIVLADYSQPAVRFEFTNNIGKGDICGAGRVGTSALDYHFPGAIVTHNVLAGAKALMYPGGNFFPSGVSAIGFADYEAGDYRLASGPYRGAGNDGLDLGADIASVTKAAAAALSGSQRMVRPLFREPVHRAR